MRLPRLLTSTGGTIQRRRTAQAVELRHTIPTMNWQTWQNLFTFNGHQYATGVFNSHGSRFLMGTSGPVHAVIDRRTSVMGEARPVWQNFVKGKPDDLFSTRELEILKRPWEGGTWRQLVTIADCDVAACGNSYWIRDGAQLIRLEPDWVTISVGEYLDGGRPVGSQLLGYAVQRPGYKAVIYEPVEVAHYRPGISVESPFRGESWLAAIASDASADSEMTQYKGNYLKNGAFGSLAVLYEPSITQTQLEQFVPVFNDKFVGLENSGKVMHLLGGRDVKALGATLDQLAFKAVQGAGETRIAAASGVPASVAGFSEGMQGSSLNAGNYTATRRLFGDAKVRPLLGSFCEAFANLVPAPDGARLWYDDSGVSFFQEDVTDEANIRQLNASTLKTLIDSGWQPDAALVAVTADNFDALKGNHSGLFSVQLQPPGSNTPSSDGAPSTQGGGDDQPQN